MGTRPYDGEGIATTTKEVIGGGKLHTYLLDTYSGKKLGMATTANAARSIGDSPTVSPTNFHLQPGQATEADLLAGVKDGFYVTELIGFGFDATSGDYSQGASGMWITNGKLSHAVNEVTIAGNLLDMFKDIDAVGDTLDATRSVASPAFRIKEMTVAGA